MKQKAKQWFLVLGLVCACAGLAGPAVQASEALNLVGLAMHRETGRDIYFGALLADRPLAQPAAIRDAGGIREMEFRVAARRTSIRSVLGGILLQAELATGQQPSPAIVEFANDVMSAVQGSLYTGDSFSVRQDSGVTTASVDGQDLARSSGRGVFEYFLAGWVDERGASTSFRDTLLAEDIDVGLRARYNATGPDPERIAAVAQWLVPAEDPAPVAAETPPAASTGALAQSESPAAAPATAVATPGPAAGGEAARAADTGANTVALATEGATTNPATTDETAGQPGDDDSVGELAAPDSEDVLATIPSLAMARIKPTLRTDDTPSAALAAETRVDDPFGVASLDVIEYSQRLAAFNSMVFRLVNSQIRYPRGAIRRGIEGSLELDVILDQRGDLVAVAVARPSGHGMLDDSALRAARKAFENPINQPLDKVALAEYVNDQQHLVIPVPVNFVLTE